MTITQHIKQLKRHHGKIRLGWGAPLNETGFVEFADQEKAVEWLVSHLERHPLVVSQRWELQCLGGYPVAVLTLRRTIGG